MEVFAKTYYCPDLVSQQDAMAVQQTLMGAPGVDEIEVDHVGHTVYVTCANQSGMSDIELVLRDAGFPPEERDEPPTFAA